MPEGSTQPADLITERMRVVPSTAELVRAEIGDRVEFARLLGARIPDDWPPDEAADALPWFLERLEAAGPSGPGWFGYYGIVTVGEDGAPVLVGGGGTVGPPADGSVEIGYSVLPAFHRRGYATEMLAAIVDWLERDPRIDRIRAETDAGNVPSRRLLDRLGFHETGSGREPNSVSYERPASKPTSAK